MWITSTAALDDRVGDGDRGQQGDRVRVQRVLVEVVGRCDLDDLAEVHHGDPVGDVPHDCQVVGDEEVREPELLLQVSSRFTICAWIETSRAETGSSQTMNAGFTRERAGKPDPLPLATRELVRVAAGRVRGQPDALEELTHTLVRLARLCVMLCTRSGSPTMRPTLCLGFSDANGSWNTICIRRRLWRSCRLARVSDVHAVEHDLPRRGP